MCNLWGGRREKRERERILYTCVQCTHMYTQQNSCDLSKKEKIMNEKNRDSSLPHPCSQVLQDNAGSQGDAKLQEAEPWAVRSGCGSIGLQDLQVFQTSISLVDWRENKPDVHVGPCQDGALMKVWTWGHVAKFREVSWSDLSISLFKMKMPETILEKIRFLFHGGMIRWWYGNLRLRSKMKSLELLGWRNLAEINVAEKNKFQRTALHNFSQCNEGCQHLEI